MPDDIVKPSGTTGDNYIYDSSDISPAEENCNFYSDMYAVQHTDGSSLQAKVQHPAKRWCAKCHRAGHRVKLKLCQINFEEAIYICVRDNCHYPLLDENLESFIVRRDVAKIEARYSRKRKHHRPSTDVSPKYTKLTDVELPKSDIMQDLNLQDITRNSVSTSGDVDMPFVNIFSNRNQSNSELDDLATTIASQSENPVQNDDPLLYAGSRIVPNGSFAPTGYTSTMGDDSACIAAVPQASNVSLPVATNEENDADSLGKEIDSSHVIAEESNLNVPPENVWVNLHDNDATDELFSSNIDDECDQPIPDKRPGPVETANPAVNKNPFYVQTNNDNSKSICKSVELSLDKEVAASTSEAQPLDRGTTLAELPAMQRHLLMLQWQNESNLCWLDVLLQCIVNSNCVRAAINCRLADGMQREMIFHRLCKVYADSQKEYNKLLCEQPSLKNVVSPEVDTLLSNLSQVRSDVFKMLQTRFSLKQGIHESVLEMFPNFIQIDPVVKQSFSAQIRWQFECENCGHQRIRRSTTEVVSFPSTSSSFHPLNATFQRSCFSCFAEDQTMDMIMEIVPPCIMMHFQHGLPHNRFRAFDFGIQGHLYSICAVIQYINHPFNHFVVWLRDCKKNKWLCCDDLQGTSCEWNTRMPKIPPQQIHMVMWEKQGLGNPQTPAGSPDTRTLHLQSIRNEEALTSGDEFPTEIFDEVVSAETIVVDDDEMPGESSTSNSGNDGKGKGGCASTSSKQQVGKSETSRIDDNDNSVFLESNDTLVDPSPKSCENTNIFDDDLPAFPRKTTAAPSTSTTTGSNLLHKSDTFSTDALKPNSKASSVEEQDHCNEPRAISVDKIFSDVSSNRESENATVKIEKIKSRKSSEWLSSDCEDPCGGEEADSDQQSYDETKLQEICLLSSKPLTPAIKPAILPGNVQDEVYPTLVLEEFGNHSISSTGKDAGNSASTVQCELPEQRVEKQSLNSPMNISMNNNKIIAVRKESNSSPNQTSKMNSANGTINAEKYPNIVFLPKVSVSTKQISRFSTCLTENSKSNPAMLQQVVNENDKGQNAFSKQGCKNREQCLDESNTGQKLDCKFTSGINIATKHVASKSKGIPVAESSSKSLLPDSAFECTNESKGFNILECSSSFPQTFRNGQNGNNALTLHMPVANISIDLSSSPTEIDKHVETTTSSSENKPSKTDIALKRKGRKKSKGKRKTPRIERVEALSKCKEKQTPNPVGNVTANSKTMQSNESGEIKHKALDDSSEEISYMERELEMLTQTREDLISTQIQPVSSWSSAGKGVVLTGHAAKLAYSHSKNVPHIAAIPVVSSTAMHLQGSTTALAANNSERNLMKNRSSVGFTRLALTNGRRSAKLMSAAGMFESYKPKRAFKLAGYKKASLKAKKPDPLLQRPYEKNLGSGIVGSFMNNKPEPFYSWEQSSEISDVSDFILPDFDRFSDYSDGSITTASLVSGLRNAPPDYSSLFDSEFATPFSTPTGSVDGQSPPLHSEPFKGYSMQNTLPLATLSNVPTSLTHTPASTDLEDMVDELDFDFNFTSNVESNLLSSNSSISGNSSKNSTSTTGGDEESLDLFSLFEM